MEEKELGRIYDHTNQCAKGFLERDFEIIKTKGRGSGVITLVEIEKGVIVFNFDTANEWIVGQEEYDNSGLLGEHSLQVGVQQFILGHLREGKVVLGFIDLLNHSCDPNLGIRINSSSNSGGEHELFALRKIKKGEELTFDYSTTMYNEEWTMECLCNSKICRKIVKEFRFLPKERRQYYLKEGALPDWLEEIVVKAGNWV